MVKSADRVMEVLEWLAERRQPATHTEIAAQLGIPGSSTSALLADMLRRGYLAADAQRRYRVGPAVMRLAGAFLRELDLPGVAEPEVTALAAELQETVGFAVPARDEMLVVCRHNWPNKLGYTMQLGDRAPLRGSASGRALLAALPPQERAALLAGGRGAGAVAAAVATGIGFCWEELVLGMTAAAVAVLDAGGRPVGALSVALPTARYDPRSFARCCRSLAASATRLSRRLGAPAGVAVRFDPAQLPGAAPARLPARRIA